MSDFENTTLYAPIDEISAYASNIRTNIPADVMQELRDKALSTPEGKAFYQKLDEIFRQEYATIDSAYSSAADKMVEFAQNAGAPESLTTQFRDYLNNSGTVTDAAANKMLEELSVYMPSKSSDSINITPDSASASVSSSTVSKVKIGSVENTNTAAKPLPTGIEVPDIRSSKSQVAEYDRLSKEYVDSLPPTELDFNNKEEYSTLTRHLQNTKDAAPLNAGNATNEDYAVISNLAYAEKFSTYEGYRIAASRDGLSVQQYCDSLLAADALAPEGKKMNKVDRAFLLSLRNNKRYNELKVDESHQMSSGKIDTSIIVLSDGDNHAFFGVEGTDGKNRDWQNDAEFASDDITSEEEYVNRYINRKAKYYDSIDIAGHSQGGREAITAAAFLDEDNKAKLHNVYCFDGPGYSNRLYNRYQDKFSSVTGNTILVYPQNFSVVGSLLHQPGSKAVYYVNTDQYPGSSIMDRHSLHNWNMGNNGYEYLDDSSFESKLIRVLSEYVVDVCPPEALTDALKSIVLLASDPNDPTAINFGAMFKNINQLSFDELTDVVGLTCVVICDAIDKVCGYAIKVTSVLEKITKIGSWLGIPYCAEINACLKIINAKLKIIQFVAKVVGAIVKYILKLKAEKRRREREAYISGHPYMKMSCEHLRLASEYMQEANSALSKADSACNSLWKGGVKKQIKSTGSELLDGILTHFWTISETILGLSYFKRLCGFAMDLLFVKGTNGHCKKGINLIATLIDYATRIDNSVGARSDSQDFSVWLSQLASSADEGLTASDEYQTVLNDCRNIITETAVSWNADDHQKLSKSANDILDKADELAKSMSQTYDYIAQLAEAYKSFQETAVEGFQTAAR